ncbi:MAG: hypothetical protein B7Z52_06900 [Burkholderiales bacterium 12-64-5]|nr:MAG: hypothetical protein B7Z52_06900 [Burkholderiales bacterium 12-64-5]
MVLKGLETLPLRMERHCANALALAQLIEAHTAVAKVHYPGLDSFPQRALAKKQMAQTGGLIALELKGGKTSAFAFLNALKIVAISNNLGDAKSLATHPATTTHSNMTPEARAAIGISDGMVECFVIYLAGHNRPPHEVLFGNDKDIAGEYERAFVGMTEVDCSLEMLLDARARLRRELPQRLSTAHKQFLSGLVRAEPDWSLVQCQHAAQLPALRWKLSNLETFRKRRPDDFAAQSAALDTGLGQS